MSQSHHSKTNAVKSADARTASGKYTSARSFTQTTSTVSRTLVTYEKETYADAYTGEIKHLINTPSKDIFFSQYQRYQNLISDLNKIKELPCKDTTFHRDLSFSECFHSRQWKLLLRREDIVTDISRLKTHKHFHSTCSQACLTHYSTCQIAPAKP